MRKDFANEVGRTQQIKRADLIEKDIILHQMLLDLSKNKFFAKNFVFKGGTCLIKCYLGYFRFSEDIDFTWKNQKVFEGKSQKAIRHYLSSIINQIGDIFEGIASERELDFKCAKHNREYVELGGGNKTCTFKIWYQSGVLSRRSFVKVQMNFVEKVLFKMRKAELKSLLTEEHEELDALFLEYKEYVQGISFCVYDVREILSEKVRAILTREGIKARDFVDVYFICKKFNIRLEDVYQSVVDKTLFMLALYEKYRRNLAEKKETVISEKASRWGEEKGLLLQKIDEQEFYKFIEDFNLFLKKVIEELA
jgi:predicted nucleotidyltransferase component of viral defense system